jgi:hypothetical protein
MRFLFLLSVCFLSLSSFCQSKVKETYIIVRLDYDYDEFHKNPFYKINAEQGNPFANDFYSLVKYDGSKNALNPNESIYPSTKDSSQKVFNYFSNSTIALRFIAENGWQLMFINNDIGSSYDTYRSGGELLPYSTVSSRPVFYFKKIIE